jgi:hypothetical protein
MNARAAIAFVVVLCAACGSKAKTPGNAGTGGAAGQAGSAGGAGGTTAQGGAGGGATGAAGAAGTDGGSAGATGTAGADVGAAGAAGGAGADGGAADATGGAGAGGATQSACRQNHGSCPGDCTSCPNGQIAASLACPIVPSNAACGGMHCCLPAPTYPCGQGLCITGKSFCYRLASSTIVYECMLLPAACAQNPTCDCLCPPSSSPAGGCSFNGRACNCLDDNGAATVFCESV